MSRGTTLAPPADGVPVFSPRLTEVMESILEGKSPNSGRFCAYCYTPLAAERAACPHCDASTAERAPLEKIPRELFEMFRKMRRRESLVVNGFAFSGLFLGLLIFVAVFYLIFNLGGSIWWYVFDIVLLFVLARGLAGLIGGIIGDELGYRYARRKLTEDWAVWQTNAERSSDA